MAEPKPLPTLHEVLKQHREELIARWGQRITGSGPQPGQLAPGELLDRKPFFVDEIIGAPRYAGEVIRRHVGQCRWPS